MCMLLHLSFKKIVPFVLKVVIWALKAKKWPCPPLPINAQNTVKKLGIDLSFSSSLVCAGFRRKKLAYLGYHPTFSVIWVYQSGNLLLYGTITVEAGVHAPIWKYVTIFMTIK